METKNDIKITGFPPAPQQKSIVDKAGSNWIALAVDEAQLAVLKLIVPRGRTAFPCPHLVADEQGKNWLVRPEAPKLLLESGKNCEKFPPRNGNSKTLVPTQSKMVKNAGLGTDMRTQRAKDGGIKVTPPGGATQSEATSLAVKLDTTSTRSAGAAKRLKVLAPKPAGKPQTAALAALTRPHKKPVIADRHPLTPASSFAPQLHPEKLTSALPEKISVSRPTNAPISTSETYLVKPAWARLKEKVVNKSAAESTEAKGEGDMEILTEPPAAWKLWLRRLLPAASVALLALGTLQLAGGY